MKLNRASIPCRSVLTWMSIGSKPEDRSVIDIREPTRSKEVDIRLGKGDSELVSNGINLALTCWSIYLDDLVLLEFIEQFANHTSSACWSAAGSHDFFRRFLGRFACAALC